MKPPHIQQNKWNKDCFMCQNLAFACEFHLKSTPTQPEYEIGYCKDCVQSTNHLNGICQKCKQPEWMKGLREDFLNADVTGNIMDVTAIKNSIADWWLSKFSTTIQKEIERERSQLLQEIEESVKGLNHFQFNEFGIETDNSEGYNKARGEILEIINSFK